MTIKTRVQLYCDIGLKCTKQIVKTLEGPDAEERMKAWAIVNKWGHWGGRDACPDCWKELHSATKPPEQVVQEAIDEEELQRAIELRRGARTAER
jgi:hypothetical protein